LLAACAAALLAACSTVPEGLRGEYAPLSPNQVGPRDIGRDVRWGGVILATRPDASRTCFEVLSRSLDRSMRPRNEDLTQGRFIGCTAGFHDPAVFKKDREISMTGRVEAIETGQVGEFEYRFPVVAADFVTMWPERPDVIIYDYYDPFFYPWYGWGPYYHYPYPYYPHRFPRVHRQGGGGERVEIPDGED
jgi:outer membrane lipoprotein